MTDMVTITLTDKGAEALFRAATNPKLNRDLDDALKRITDEQMTLEQAAREVIRSWDGHMTVGHMTVGVLRGTLERLQEALEALDSKLASEGPQTGSQSPTDLRADGAPDPMHDLRGRGVVDDHGV